MIHPQKPADLAARLRLGVNIDHVATLRQARYAGSPDSPNAEPSVLAAARDAAEGGADSITVHLRADRRHIQNRDVEQLRAEDLLPLNLEMGDTEEIVAIALRLRPAFVCLVPENRREITTEGGLDVEGQREALASTIGRLRQVGIRVSLFVDAEIPQIRAAAAIGADMVELHTGAFSNTPPQSAARAAEVEKLAAAAEVAHSAGLQVNAGHGLTVQNLPDLFRVPHVAELNIGHHLVSRAIAVGLRDAVREMRECMASWPHPAGTPDDRTTGD